MNRVAYSAAWAVACLQALALLSGCGGGLSSSGGGGGTQPYITSFTSGATTIEAGTSTTLTGVFGGGSGVITPGNISVTSGTAVTMTPPITTTYTLTVTGSSGTTPATQTAKVTVDPVPAITSFTASPNPVTSGGSVQLTAVFAGGTGVITGPGNLSTAVTSGTPVSVTAPTTTTTTTATYKLTVAPPVGTVTATESVSVTVSPAGATIASFTVGVNPLVAGNSTSLTANFSGGTGVITPGASGGATGSISVTSGTPVPVDPALTTTFTLTVTPAIGSAATDTVTVTVDPAVTVCLSASCNGPAVSSLLLGMNLVIWWDDVGNASSVVSAFQTAGIRAVHWPGGVNSDGYHWNGTATYPALGSPTNCGNGYSVPDNTFANFESDILIPGNFDLAITADYGSDPACTGPGVPSEAAAWAEAAVADGLPVHYMTIGNEVYGSWEYDLHPTAEQHDPTTYASEMVGSGGFYDMIKAQSPTTLVGVDVDAGCTTANDCTDGWDATVLSKALGSYDFVEYHFYPQTEDVTSDALLVQQAAQIFTDNINIIKSELAAAGATGTPIFVGEVGANTINPGTQSWSITQGLFAGQMLGEAMNDGVARLTWWMGFGDCQGGGNNAATLYGWQNTWGADNVFSDGPSDSECPGAGPIGTMSPVAQAFNLFHYVVNAAKAPAGGESTLETTVLGDSTDVRAYAASHSGGTALMLFNLNETTAEAVSVSLTGTSQTTSSDVQMITYDKAIYDESNPANTGGVVWAPATTTDLGQQTLPMTLTLQPWSMNVVIVQP